MLPRQARQTYGDMNLTEEEIGKVELEPLWISKPGTQKTENVCVGCGERVTPGTCRTGSVLGNLQHLTIKGERVIPIMGSVEIPGTVHVFRTGTEIVTTTRKVAFHKRHKGFLCGVCASNYRGIKDKNGKFHPFVKIDATEGFFRRVDTKFYQHERDIDPAEEELDRYLEPIDVSAYRAINKLNGSPRRVAREDSR